MNAARILKDVADATVGFVGKMTPHYRDEGVTFLRSQDVRPHRIDVASALKVDPEFEARIRKSRLRAGDVVVVRTGKPGTSAVVPPELEGANCSDLVVIRPGPELSSEWLSYYINAAAQGFVRERLVGAVQQHFNVKSALEMPVPVLSLSVQEAQASVLGALDDKIAANRHVADIAMELGEMLVRRGATDSAPRSIADLADVVMGASPRGECLNEEGLGVHFYQGVRDFGRVFPEPRVSTTSSVRIAPKGATLFAVRAPVGEVNLAVEDVCIGRGVASLSSTEWPATLHFSLRAFKSIWDEYQGGGTVFASVNGRDVREMRLPMPNDPEGSIERSLASLLARAVHAERENSRLAAIRDELLPLLMSGKIIVKDAEKTVEEVA